MKSQSKQFRSWIMSQVRSKDTKPEQVLRSALHRNGYRFKLHSKDLPGRPDIVLSKYKAVIFVHGCYWHQHNGCKKSTRPKTNIEFWNKKLEANILRDKTNQDKLNILGWHVIIAWECEIHNDLSSTVEKIKMELQGENLE